MRFDFCIVGGGIVGLAAARAILERHPGASLVVMDKERELGCHQTGRNSGVIHSGIYYSPGSLKARLCREGAERTKRFCQQNGIPFEDRGKLIVATRPSEIKRLRALNERARINGIETAHLTAGQIAEREPNVAGLEAVSVPTAAIVSYRRILETLAAEIVQRGGEIRFAASPERIVEQVDGVEIDTGGDIVRCSRLVACAGLNSDRIAMMAGLSIDFRIIPFRGEYFRLPERRSDVVRSMIYPVPEPTLPFLGIHLTPMIDGSVTVGPNAILGLAREGYLKWSANLRDVADMVSFPGFWRVLARNLRPGLMEMANSMLKSRYLAECRRYCPSLELSDLEPMSAGIRAQAVRRDGSMVQDFLMLQTDRMLHVCNAPSPAATSALPIGDMIADRLLGAHARPSD